MYIGISLYPELLVITSIGNTSASVVITGSGFLTAGPDVSLENGRGARPTVSNIDVQNDTTITALITVKNGAKAGTWDVRAGTGVLVDGFTVTAP